MKKDLSLEELKLKEASEKT